MTYNSKVFTCYLPRVIITHVEWGVYLGSCMGLGFWSRLDPVGQDSAVTFDNDAQALLVVQCWDSQPDQNDLRLVEVQVQSENRYATIEEISAADPRLRWDPAAGGEKECPNQYCLDGWVDNEVGTQDVQQSYVEQVPCQVCHKHCSPK